MPQTIVVQSVPVGVFLSMDEWECLQQTIRTTRDEWFAHAVQEGLASLQTKEYVPNAAIQALFAQAGAHVG